MLRRRSVSIGIAIASVGTYTIGIPMRSIATYRAIERRHRLSSHVEGNRKQQTDGLQGDKVSMPT